MDRIAFAPERGKRILRLLGYHMRDYAALVVLGSWLAFLPIMLLRLAGQFGHTARRNPRSRLGVAVVAIGFALVWPGVSRRPPPFALAPRTGAALSVVSAAIGLWAILTLGRQWSLQARLRTDHQLITRGPYYWVRHPVYSAFFGMLVATGLVFARGPWQLAGGALLYLAGTALRLRAEEALLRQQFGAAFDPYARTTPALFPAPFSRSSTP
jgi:protein-S-isoprenylcysteine O-methyltransferase Ste14